MTLQLKLCMNVLARRLFALPPILYGRDQFYITLLKSVQSLLFQYIS